MTRKSCLIVLLAALPLLAEQDANQRGWTLFEQARAAAGAEQPLRDYAFRQISTIQRDGNIYQVASRVQTISGKAQRLEIESQNGIITMLVNGDQGWRGSALGKQPLPAEAVALQKSEDARVNALFGDVEADTVRFRSEAQVNGRPADVIELANVGGTPLRLFIDRETKDVVKRVYVGDAPNGMMAQVEEILSDYKEIDGVRWPHAKKVIRNGQEASTSKLQEVRINQGLTVAQLTQ